MFCMCSGHKQPSKLRSDAQKAFCDLNLRSTRAMRLMMPVALVCSMFPWSWSLRAWGLAAVMQACSVGPLVEAAAPHLQIVQSSAKLHADICTLSQKAAGLQSQTVKAQVWTSPHHHAVHDALVDLATQASGMASTWKQEILGGAVAIQGLQARVRHALVMLEPPSGGLQGRVGSFGVWSKDGPLTYDNLKPGAFSGICFKMSAVVGLMAAAHIAGV